MSLKKNLIVFLIISILGTIGHFLYEWTNYNMLIGYISPVNESVWEHLKLLFFPAILFFIAEYFTCDNKQENYISSSVLGIFAGLLSIIALFYTYSGVLGYNISFFDIAIYYVGVAVMLTVRTLVIKNQLLSSKNAKIVSIVVIIIMCVAFFTFSYNRPVLGIFIPPTA